MTPVLGIIASSNQQGRAGGPVGAYDALATITVPSGGLASVTFAGIPLGYKHLQIRAMHRNSGTGWQGFTGHRINGDSSSIYSLHQMNGSGSGTINAVGTGSTNGIFYNNGSFFYNTFCSTALASAFAVSIYDYLDYANTNKFKTIRALEGHEGNNNDANSRIQFASASYQSTSAVTSISFATWDENGNASSFIAGSTFALYGVK
jgi:hypothetical protein